MQQRSEATAGALPNLLQTDDPALRSACSDVQTSMPSAVASNMQEQLHDINPVGRRIAISRLADLDRRDIQTRLAQVLDTEPAKDCMATAVEVLARLDAIELTSTLHTVRQLFLPDACLNVAIAMAIAVRLAID
jgi:hypothetical protein